MEWLHIDPRVYENKTLKYGVMQRLNGIKQVGRRRTDEHS